MTASGVPKAAPTLHHNRIVASRAARSTGGTRRPFRSSRLMMPLQFAAVSKDAMGAGVSKTRDNEHALAILGKADIERVTRRPSAHVPDFFKRVDNCLKCGPGIRREKATDVLEDEPLRPCDPNKVDESEDEAAVFAVESGPPGVRVTDILARPASAPDFSFRDCRRVEGRDVAMQGYLRPVAAEHHLAVGVDLALEHDAIPGALEAEIEAADSREERRQPES